MELKVEKAFQDGIEIPDNFIITEILDGLDAFENPMKIKGESGQHTIASLLGDMDRIKDEIDLKLAEKNQLIEKLNAVETFLNQ